MPDEKPKIIIDSDWKSQAQAERDRLAEAEKAKAASKEPTDLPEASFDELVRMLATQAMLYMGVFPDPQSGRAVVALDLARLNIDLLEVLEQKSKGNLTEEEGRMLGGVLHELRLRFVQVQKLVERAIAEGRAQSIGMAGGAPGAPTPGADTPPA